MVEGEEVKPFPIFVIEIQEHWLQRTALQEPGLTAMALRQHQSVSCVWEDFTAMVQV